MSESPNYLATLLTHKQVAEFFGVDPATVWNWRKTGMLGCRKIGRWVRYSQQDIEDFIEKIGHKAEGQGRNEKSKGDLKRGLG